MNYFINPHRYKSRGLHTEILEATLEPRRGVIPPKYVEGKTTNYEYSRTETEEVDTGSHGGVYRTTFKRCTNDAITTKMLNIVNRSSSMSTQQRSNISLHLHFGC